MPSAARPTSPNLTNDVPRGMNVESYVRNVKDKSLLRQMMGIFTEGLAEAATIRTMRPRC